MADVFGKHQPKIPYQPIADLLAQYRRRDPDKLAIVDLDQETLDQLRRARARGHRHRRGAQAARRRQRQPRAAAVATRRLEKLLIWLATWRLGAVVAPLNIELNATLIAGLATAVDPVLTLVHKELDGDALLAGRPFVRFGTYTRDAADADPEDDFFRSDAARHRPDSLPERNEAADIACIFCTSGTTSRPKIVVYDHCAYWLNGLSTLECLGLTGGRPHLGIPLVRLELGAGAQPHAVPRKGPDDAHRQALFAQPLLRVDPEPTASRLPPAFPRCSTCCSTSRSATPRKDVPTLRLMTCSTAPLTREQWVRFEEMYGVKLLQMYGMSEAGWMCGNRHYSSRMGTVGLPALHQEFEIVDGEGRPCPPNVEGEVTAGGPHCAVGYLLDDGTIEPIRGQRIKSGDLAIMDEDGFIRVSGRTKDLIIRGGVNIAPLEIDEVLLKHPGDRSTPPRSACRTRSTARRSCATWCRGRARA